MQPYLKALEILFQKTESSSAPTQLSLQIPMKQYLDQNELDIGEEYNARQDTRIGSNTRGDRVKAQCFLFCLFTTITALVVVIFAVAPIYRADTAVHGERRTEAWMDACNSYDETALAALGLS